MPALLLLAACLCHLSVFTNALPWDKSTYLQPNKLSHAEMARYVVHQSDWLSLATISNREDTKGYPQANVFATSDGNGPNSTGVPYLYVTELDVSAIDLKADHRCSALMTLAATDYCKNKQYDQEDPRCARVFLTGIFKAISNTSEEHEFGLQALFGRHPQMASWPESHHFYLGKLDIQQVGIFDSFGGVKTISLREYYTANVSQATVVEQTSSNNQLVNTIEVIEIRF